MRDDVVMMARIRNEERWIARNLERTFQVAKTVVLWDDGSTDETYKAVFDAMGSGKRRRFPMPGVQIIESAEGQNVLHYLVSPFRPSVNAMEEVSEIRDKNLLWWYVKAQVKFKHVLCVDGDEMLSREAVRHFDEAIAVLEGGIDMLAIPFIYLWNNEQTRRADGIYGNRDGTRPNEVADGLPRLRFPRLFTIMRVDPYDLFEMRFAWMGHRQGRKVLGGFHCGSVPQEGFIPKNAGPTFPYPIVHFGYMDKEDRERKFAWYSKIDPGNKFEGEYLHMIEKPNIHAPGPTKLEPWKDE